MDFLKKVSSIKLVEDKDTAETARKFRKKTVKRGCSNTSKTAAEMYGLEILAQEIQTIK
jgi:prephenate dehydratase